MVLPFSLLWVTFTWPLCCLAISFTRASPTVEGIKDFFLIFRGDTDACVSYLQDCRFCRMNVYSNGTGRPVIFDRIFNQIIDCPVQKDIAACNSTVTFCLNKPDLMLVCNRIQIAENFFCECCKGNCVRTLYS